MLVRLASNSHESVLPVLPVLSVGKYTDKENNGIENRLNISTELRG